MQRHRLYSHIAGRRATVAETVTAFLILDFRSLSLSLMLKTYRAFPKCRSSGGKWTEAKLVFHRDE